MEGLAKNRPGTLDEVRAEATAHKEERPTVEMDDAARLAVQNQGPDSAEFAVLEQDALERLETALGEISRQLEAFHTALTRRHLTRPDLTRFEAATAQLKSLQQMLQELLLIRKLDRMDFDPKRDQVDLVALVRKSARGMSSRCQRQHKPLVVDSDQQAMVMADGELLLRMLETMMSLSLDHGLPHRPVMVYIERDSSTATVHLVSKGCNREEGVCPCDKVHQGEYQSRLLFCRKVAWANWGWTNLAKSVAGQGLDFSVTIPLVNDQADLCPTPYSGLPQIDY